MRVHVLLAFWKGGTHPSVMGVFSSEEKARAAVESYPEYRRDVVTMATEEVDDPSACAEVTIQEVWSKRGS